MPFLGPKTKEILEQEIFSVTNQIIKRNFYTPEKISAMRSELYSLCVQYKELK